MEAAGSTALIAIVPCGAAADPAGAEGAAAVAAEWLMRGAGDRNSRQLSGALDTLGAQHSLSAGHRFLRFSSLQLNRNLPGVLDIAADIILRPALHDEHFAACRDLAIQDIASLEDEPTRRAGLLLRERFFPWPLGRMTLGTTASLNNMAAAAVREHIRSRLVPAGSVIGIAGNLDFDDMAGRLETLFAAWTGDEPGYPDPALAPGGVLHCRKDTAQQQIAVAHPAPLLRDTNRYYPARVFEAILSHGMGSRLFVEVREKRGLAYHVSSGYGAIPEAAGMFTTAASRPDTAAETLAVLAEALSATGEAITEDELARAKVQIRSALVMQGQSPAGRAAALVADWVHLGRVRTPAEISEHIRTVEKGAIIEYLAAFPFRDPVMVTVGPNELPLPRS